MDDDTQQAVPHLRIICPSTPEARMAQAAQVAESFTQEGTIKRTAVVLGTSRGTVRRILNSAEGQGELARIRGELNMLQRQRLSGLADLALNALESTLTNARPDSMARVNAAQTVLDRAGHWPIERQEVLLHGHVTIEQRTERLAEILATARNRRDGQTSGIDTGDAEADLGVDTA